MRPPALATNRAIKTGRERCPQHSGTDARNGLYDKNGSGAMPATEGVHSGNDARNGLYDKNGSGTMPANEHVRYGNDARNGLCEKNGSGQSAAFLKVSCGNDARTMPATDCTIKMDRDSSTPFGVLKI